jgi:hypothetical protein
MARLDPDSGRVYNFLWLIDAGIMSNKCITKWGNSLPLRLPSADAKAWGVAEGHEV